LVFITEVQSVYSAVRNESLYETDTPVFKGLNNTIGSRRPVGKPKRRWIKAVEEDSKKILGIRHLKREETDRRRWRNYTQEAKATCPAVTP
jgi:hypothetical protein